MSLIRNPLTWLRRIRHRRGHGIHSPFAYNLVTQVLYNPGTYYAYALLDRLQPRHVQLFHLRPRAVHRLLFRLANYRQPQHIAAPGLTPTEWNCLHEGCRHAVIDTAMPATPPDMLLLHPQSPETSGKSPSLADDWHRHINDNTLLVVLDLPRNRALWQSVRSHPRTRITFDLADLGIAFFLPRLNRQHYIINW